MTVHGQVSDDQAVALADRQNLDVLLAIFAALDEAGGRSWRTLHPDAPTAILHLAKDAERRGAAKALRAEAVRWRASSATGGRAHRRYRLVARPGCRAHRGRRGAAMNDTGIRLANNTPVPPAPNLGTHQDVTAGGVRLGAVIETALASHVPVCSRCHIPLPPRLSHRLAAGALYGHWETAHPEAVT